MGRARRAKKESYGWAIVLVLVCIFVVGGTFYMLFDIKSKVGNIKKSDNTISNNVIENNISDENNEQNIKNETNAVENIVSNEIDNTANVVSNIVENKISSNNTVKNNTIPDKPAIPAVTDDKQKAIDLVKKEWGNDDTVSFVFDYINENGEYVVAVKDKSSATVKNYFRVNIKNGNVELD